MPQNIQDFIFWLFGGAIVILGFMLKSQIKDLKDGREKNRTLVEDMGKEVSEVKTNYLDRFNSVEKRIAESHAAIIERINALDVKLVGEYMKQSNCPLLHESKGRPFPME